MTSMTAELSYKSYKSYKCGCGAKVSKNRKSLQPKRRAGKRHKSLASHVVF